MKKYSNDEILLEFKTFSDNIHSLIISSVNKNNTPLTSYSPFVEDDDSYYICISSKLPHFQNLIHTKQAHLFLVEDEKSANHIYARKRLYFDATCELVVEEEPIFDLFDKRYGESLSFLRNMQDFKILKLTAKQKSLVLGFGAAYTLNEDGTIEQKTIKHES